jgi:hypothetical protein
MPGIADSPNSLAVQPSSNEVSQTPVSAGIGEFMQAFKDGFITTEDITKRTLDKPLENAQREQALADTNIIRPKQREVAAKQLDVQSKQTDTLAQLQPLLSETGIQQAQQQLDNVRAHENPAAIAALHRQYALPLLGKEVPYDEKTGQIDTQAALKDIQHATDLARAYQFRQFAVEHAKPQSTTTVDKTGKKTTTEQYVVPGTGAALTEPRVSESTDINQPEAIKGFNKQMQDDPTLKPDKEAQGYLQTAKSVLATPPEKITNAEDQVLVESLIKLTDPAGVIRQSKVEYLREMTPVWQSAVKRFQHLASNQNTVLSPQDRDQISRAINRLEEGYGRAAVPRLEKYQKDAEGQGLTPEQIFDSRDLGILKKYSGSAPASSASPAVSPDAETPVKVNSPAEAPPTAKFIQSPDGRVFKNPNYTGQ